MKIVRHQPPPGIGQVRWCDVRNPRQEEAPSPKKRPAVLIRPIEGWWIVHGFTTLSHYGDGKPRQPVPDQLELLGHLEPRSYLWGNHQTMIPGSGVHEYISHATPRLVRALLDHTDLTIDEAAAMLTQGGS